MARVRAFVEELPKEESMVEVLVLPKGDGQISNGKHHPKLGDEFYDEGETFEVAKSIALNLESRGYVVRTALMKKPEHLASVQAVKAHQRG